MPANIFIVVFAAVLLASVAAKAQPIGSGARSIDATVANADLVVVAKIEKVGDEKRVNGREVCTATIAIQETLKKNLFQDEPYRRMQAEMPFSAVVLVDWQERSCSLLIAYDEQAPHASTVINLSDEKLKVLTADLKLLRDPAAVIKAAKEALRLTPATIKRIHVFGLDVPRAVRAGTSWEEFGYFNLEVPVDQRLEKRAHVYLRSNDYGRRSEAARALRFFHSEGNIALAKTLLDDSTWGILQPPDENGIEERYYGVRAAAYQALKTWGVEVEQPVIRERKAVP